MPSVAMKGGSRRRVISTPFSAPMAVVMVNPHKIARIGGTPSSTANLVMTTLPRAMITAAARSMPEVRITSVWPMAITATKEICFSTRDSVVAVRKRSDCVAKKMQASSRAIKGPNVERLGSAGRLAAGGAVAG